MSDDVTEVYSRFFEVKTELFDGPLDLLLHLVKKRELPIEKLSLAEVTGQYLDCVKSLTYYDVEVAAEYLVIAATLLSVKASVLLNEPVEFVVDENGELVDPHEELMARLRALQAYRASAHLLSERPTLGHEVFSSPPKISKIDPALIPLADHTTELLATAFQEVLKKLGERNATLRLSLDTVSIVDRMRGVIDILRHVGGTTTFTYLLSSAQDKISAVGTFVAILELCRRHMLAVAQSTPRGEIQITLTSASDLPANVQADPDDQGSTVEVAA
jgi:segregation and condensation protein A